MPDELSSEQVEVIIARVREQARVEATRADGSVDAEVELRAFRRLASEAAAADPE
jgi:hypothetical protein